VVPVFFLRRGWVSRVDSQENRYEKSAFCLVPAVDGGMAHVASRPRAPRLLKIKTSSENSTISLFQWTLVGGKKCLRDGLLGWVAIFSDGRIWQCVKTLYPWRTSK
jgi:hypothetical protein